MLMAHKNTKLIRKRSQLISMKDLNMEPDFGKIKQVLGKRKTPPSN